MTYWNSLRTIKLPLPSRATRKLPTRSRMANRSLMVDPHRGRLIGAESNPERRTAFLLLARRDVVDLWDQPPVVHFRDAAGKKRRHTFDFLATLESGEKVAIAVKPLAKAKSQKLEATLAIIAPQIDPAFATSVALVTEADLDPVAVRNAVLIYSAAREPFRDVDAEAAVRAALSTASEQTVGDVIAATGLKGRAFRAIVRLIADFEIEPATADAIDYDLAIRLVTGGAA